MKGHDDSHELPQSFIRYTYRCCFCYPFVRIESIFDVLRSDLSFSKNVKGGQGALTFSPPRMIMSFTVSSVRYSSQVSPHSHLSLMNRKPSSSRYPASPVSSHPSGSIVSLVAAANVSLESPYRWIH